MIPAGQTAWISRPDQSIRELWTSPTTHTFVFLKPGQKARFDQITRDLTTLTSNFPHRSGDTSLQHRLNQLAYRYPPPIFWLLVGLIALLVRRPRGTKALAMLTGAALTIIAFNALAQSADPDTCSRSSQPSSSSRPPPSLATRDRLIRQTDHMPATSARSSFEREGP